MKNMFFKKFLSAIIFISIATAISIAGYLYFAKQSPALAQTLGENIYISQSGSGSQNGSDCNNAYPVSWFNISGNWANPKQSGKIGPGDTAHLCEAISTNLTVQGSGSVGTPIIILFESGAKLSKSHWNGANNDSAIFGGNDSVGISYITIDGGTDGVIEATDNGTNKTYQFDNKGIYFRNSSHMIIKNLTIRHIYDRVEGTENNAFGSGVYFGSNTHDITIQNNNIYDANSGIFISFRQGDSDVFISGNAGGRFGHGAIILGSANISCTLSNVSIYNNNFTKGREWSGQPAIHTDLIHTFAVHSGSRIDGLKIYNNRFSGKCGTNSTALVFLEGYVYSPQIYNNLLIKESDPGGACGNGMMYFKKYSLTNDGFLVANNTFIADTSGIGFAVLGATGGILKNNLFNNVAIPVSSPYDTVSIGAVDNNIYYYSGTVKFTWGSYTQNTFAQWLIALQNSGLSEKDLNSSIETPILDFDYLPLVSDIIARDKGLNLSDYFTADKSGISRPQGSAWDIGAYEYIQTPPPLKADFNSDSKVNDLDFTSFKNAFKSIFNSIFDLNSDNAIDVKDLGVLMSGWLP